MYPNNGQPQPPQPPQQPQPPQAPYSPVTPPTAAQPAMSPVPNTTPQPAVPSSINSPSSMAPTSTMQPPLSPVPQPMVQPYATPPPQDSKKGLIIGLSALGGLIVVALIAVGVWFSMFYVSGADYQKVTDSYNAMKTLADEIDNAGNYLGSSSTTPPDADALDKKADELQSIFESMATLRAIKKDTKLKAAYDDFAPAIKDTTTFIHAYAEFARVVDRCDSLMTSSTNACIDDLRGLKDKNSKPVTDLAAAAITYVDDYDTTALLDASDVFNESVSDIFDELKSKADAFKSTLEKSAN